jgi:hypothetical protein
MKCQGRCCSRYYSIICPKCENNSAVAPFHYVSTTTLSSQVRPHCWREIARIDRKMNEYPLQWRKNVVVARSKIFKHLRLRPFFVLKRFIFLTLPQLYPPHYLCVSLEILIITTFSKLPHLSSYEKS